MQTSTPAQRLWPFGWGWIGAGQFRSGLVSCEHPFAQDADFGLNHVQPAWVLWSVMELDPAREKRAISWQDLVMSNRWPTSISKSCENTMLYLLRLFIYVKAFLLAPS